MSAELDRVQRQLDEIVQAARAHALEAQRPRDLERWRAAAEDAGELGLADEIGRALDRARAARR